MENRKAILAGGCFWCLEAAFERIPGVLEVENGYCGGHVDNPSYEAVCTGTTGHAEAVRITYDPARVRYSRLLDLFWKIHDPTTYARQGADIGDQYRAVIFYVDEEQRKEALESLERERPKHAAPIVTKIEEAGTFWPAEAYHQDYFRHNPDAPYCRFVIAPKLKKAAV